MQWNITRYPPSSIPPASSPNTQFTVIMPVLAWLPKCRHGCDIWSFGQSPSFLTTYILRKFVRISLHELSFALPLYHQEFSEVTLHCRHYRHPAPGPSSSCMRCWRRGGVVAWWRGGGALGSMRNEKGWIYSEQAGHESNPHLHVSHKTLVAVSILKLHCGASWPVGRHRDVARAAN